MMINHDETFCFLKWLDTKARDGKIKKKTNAGFFEMFHGVPYLEKAVCDSHASNNINTSPFLM